MNDLLRKHPGTVVKAWRSRPGKGSKPNKGDVRQKGSLQPDAAVGLGSLSCVFGLFPQAEELGSREIKIPMPWQSS